MITIKSNIAIENRNIPMLGEILIDLAPTPVNTGNLDVKYSKSTDIYGDCSIYSYNGSLLSNPFTVPENTSKTFSLRNAVNDKVFHFPDKFYITELNIGYITVISYLEDISEISNLTKLNLNGTMIRGDVMSLCDLKNLTQLYLALTQLKIDVKALLKGLAVGRTSGTMNFIAGGVNVSNYPVEGVGDTYAHRCDIYFNESYPDGYYIRAIDGTYYNANGEVITP